MLAVGASLDELLWGGLLRTAPCSEAGGVQLAHDMRALVGLLALTLTIIPALSLTLTLTLSLTLTLTRSASSHPLRAGPTPYSAACTRHACCL